MMKYLLMIIAVVDFVGVILRPPSTELTTLTGIEVVLCLGFIGVIQAVEKKR